MAMYHALDPNKDEIRLLELSPGRATDRLRGKLLHAPLAGDCRLASSDLVPYESLSYCWGDPTDCQSIEIGNHSLNIPSSAHKALCRLRLEDSTRLVWVDSACINLDDHEERVRQVAMMHKVYSFATTNLVWLGEADGSEEFASHGLECLERDMQNETHHSRHVPEILYTGSGLRTRSESRVLPAGSDVDAVFKMFSMPWFTRVWTVQEAALAKNSICFYGNATFDLALAFRAAAWLMYKRQALPSTGHDETELWRVLRRSDLIDRRHGLFMHDSFRASPFRNLLVAAKEFKASNPRDYIYGTLGMYQHLCPTVRLPQALFPDYDKPLHALYTAASRFCIEETQSLDVLQDVVGQSLEEKESEGMPSWVHNWSRPFDQNEDEMYLPSFYDAAGGETVNLQAAQHPESPLLVVQGFVVDTVKDVNSPYQRHSRDHFMHEAHDLCVANAEDEDGQGLSSTLIAGCNNAYKPASPDDLASMHDVVRSVISGDLNLAGIQDKTPTDQAERCIRAYHRACRDRRFFVTRDGRLGIGSRKLQVGDSIVILYGSRLPLLLRKIVDKGEHLFIGSCHVHGIMYGEAAQAHKASASVDMVFRIR